MGFKISWLAFQGKARADVLASLDLADSGILDERYESPISVADFPNGWTVLFLNEFLHPYCEDDCVTELSHGCTVLSGRVHEGIMYCSASLFENGSMIWSVSHDAQEDLYNLQTEGELPGVFSTIKARQVDEQNEAGGKDTTVDHIIDIPVQLSKAFCGFEYSASQYDWGQPRFTQAEERKSLQ